MLDTVLEPAQPLLRVAFTLLGSPVTWLELVAFALGVWMVLCNLRVNPLAWPLAIVSSLLYALLFADSRLYGEAALQLFFIAVAFWGWWQWLRGRGEDGRALAVHRLAPAARWRALAATALAWPALALLLDHATDSDVPWMDALPTVGSIAGQFLLGRKLVENWPVWVAVNLFSIVLFGLKGLWLTVLLYAVFAVMAAFGWRAWLRLVDEGHGR
ncbi:transporter [Rubrivivax gelatinosus]|nr:transporter [Rubrivivax gelatinosus]